MTTKARPLQKRYSPLRPYVVQRHDQDDGSIYYEIWDERPESYRRLCVIEEDANDDYDEPCTDRGQAKRDADLIAKALNGLITS
jgi:hypothetical protein